MNTWNIYVKTSEYFYVLCSSTNNTLERYNKEMNKDFMGRKPNFFLFIIVCEENSNHQYKVQGILREEKMVIFFHKSARINEVPTMYISYIYNGKFFKKKEKYRKGTCTSKTVKKV